MKPEEEFQPFARHADPRGPTSLTDDLRLFASLKEEKRGKEIETRIMSDALEKLEENIINKMADQGIQSLKVDGTSFFLAREFFCRSKESISREQVICAFVESGHGDLLMPSYQTIRAIVREQAEAGQEIDPRITAVMDVGDTTRLRMRG